MIISGKSYCPGCMKPMRVSEKCLCGFDEKLNISQAEWLPIGTLLRESIVVGKVIAQGGFGIIYVGYDRYLNLKVAIKELFISSIVWRNSLNSKDVIPYGEDEAELFTKYREDFIHEASTLARFKDESGLASVHSFFDENGTSYIVMEFVEGIDLGTYLEHNGKMTYEEGINLLMPVLKTLNTLHEQRIVHRDISPDNIMVGPDGDCKLLDIGNARECNDDGLTMTVILKPGFAPKEQYRSHAIQGPWTDIYSICATICNCITGEVPDSVIDREQNDNELAEMLIRECGSKKAAILLKGMEIKAQDRYQSVNELMQDLIRVMDKKNDEGDDSHGISRSRVMILSMIAALIAVSIGAIFFVAGKIDADDVQVKQITEETDSDITIGEISADTTTEEMGSDATSEEDYLKKHGEENVSHIYLTYLEDADTEQIEQSLAVVEARLDIVYGADNYCMTNYEDHTEILVPMGVITSENICNWLKNQVFSSGTLYLMANRHQIAFPIEQIEKVELAAEILDGTKADEAGKYQYYTITVSDEMASIIRSKNDERLKAEDSTEWFAIRDYDLYYDGEIQSFGDLPFYQLAYLSDDCKTLQIRTRQENKKMNERECRLISGKTIKLPFEFDMQTPVRWMTEDESAKLFGTEGVHKVIGSYFADNDVPAVDIMYSYYLPVDDMSMGEKIDFCRRCMRLFEDLETPYAIGTLDGNTGVIVFRVAADNIVSSFLKSNPRGAIYSYDCIDIFPTNLTTDVIFENGVVKLPILDELDSYGEQSLEEVRKAMNNSSSSHRGKVYWVMGDNMLQGTFDEENNMFIFDRATFTVDGAIPDSFDKAVRFLNHHYIEDERQLSVSFLASGEYRVLNSFEDTKSEIKYGLSNQMNEEIRRYVAEQLKNSIGVETEVTYEDEEIGVYLFQNISDRYADNLYRLMGVVLDLKPEENEELIFRGQVTKNIFFLNENGQETFEISVHPSDKEIILFKTRRFVTGDEKLLDEQAGKLMTILQNDPMYSGYEIIYYVYG